jgi:hypothetical protein
VTRLLSDFRALKRLPEKESMFGLSNWAGYLHGSFEVSAVKFLYTHFWTRTVQMSSSQHALRRRYGVSCRPKFARTTYGVPQVAQLTAAFAPKEEARADREGDTRAG